MGAPTRALVALGLLALLAAACGVDPRLATARSLAAELETALGRLERNPTQPDGCADVGTVRGKLYAEVGRLDLPEAWSSLRDATDALLAVCGQVQLLRLPPPTPPDPRVDAARARWQSDVPRQLRVACAALRTADTRLGRPPSTCFT